MGKPDIDAAVTRITKARVQLDLALVAFIEAHNNYVTEQDVFTEAIKDLPEGEYQISSGAMKKAIAAALEGSSRN